MADPKAQGKGELAKPDEKPVQGDMVFYGRAEPANMSPAVRAAIGGLKVREIPGIAESWNDTAHERKAGDFIAGICVQYRERVSQYESDVIVLETADGFKSVWLGVDLKAKITAQSVGRPMVIEYQGTMTRPRAKGAIKSYRVLEIIDPRLTG